MTLSNSWEEIDDLYPTDEPAPIDPKDKLFPWPTLYPNLSRKPHRFSYSTLDLFHSCERKFHLLRNQNVGLSLGEERQDKHNNVHLDYGNALGVGFQSYLKTGSITEAVWAALSVYHYADETKNKCDLSIIKSIQALAAQWPIEEWEILGTELSFKIILDEETQDYYCGYVDAVLRNRITGAVCVVEVKTTGYKFENLEPMYSNSGQGIGYSVVLNQIAQEKASWTVLYIVVQLKAQNIIPTLHIYPFEKIKKDRLEWLLTLQLDYKRIIEYEQLQFWPKRGGKCFTFNKACVLYGLCDLQHEGNEELIKKEDKWMYTYLLSDLITQQMAA